MSLAVPRLLSPDPQVAPSRAVRPVAVATTASAKSLGGRKLRVAVVGGGPSGACAAETLAKAGIEAFVIERKMDNCKPCGGAIPLCMIEEFDLPMEIVDRKVTKMKMISPSNRAVDVGQTLSETEYIGMCRREVFDDFLRRRAQARHRRRRHDCEGSLTPLLCVALACRRAVRPSSTASLWAWTCRRARMARTWCPTTTTGTATPWATPRRWRLTR